MQQTLLAWQRPVLQSVTAVVTGSEHVATNLDAIERVAAWMAYEGFPRPSTGPANPLDWGSDLGDVVDAIMVKEALDFAFTDFSTGIRFETEYLGTTWSDSEALTACLHRASAVGEWRFDGDFLTTVTVDLLGRVFRGNIEMPMLDERAAVLVEIGELLADRYEGRFHRFVASCAPALYAGGDGLLERLTSEFPRFADQSPYRGRAVVFHKLAQLAAWSLHLRAGGGGGVHIGDLEAMTAFADYIVPVALRLLGIIEYSDSLERRIMAGELLAADSPDEVEIRAHTLYATALLTEAINRRRPEGRRVLIPQIDYRLWSAFHETTWPHHRTRTIMY